MYNLATGRKRGISLTDNVGLITAYGNDLSYDDVFSGQLEALMDEGDLLVVVSGSGNSPNILRAIKTAQALKGDVLGVLGYDGGKALPMCDEVFHTPSWDMQICRTSIYLWPHGYEDHLFCPNKKFVVIGSTNSFLESVRLASSFPALPNF